MSVYVFKTKKRICCKNVPDMHLWGEMSKKKIFLIRILGSALFLRVGRETGNT